MFGYLSVILVGQWDGLRLFLGRVPVDGKGLELGDHANARRRRFGVKLDHKGPHLDGG